MHKDTKWARQIIALQEDDGKWGCFHSLSKFYGAPLTTEQALRRLERLGYSIEDECISRAVAYMDDCLTGHKAIPDRTEKGNDWDVFTALMLAAWICRFTHNNLAANEVARQWSTILTAAFETGEYKHDKYVLAYQDIFGKKPRGGRLIDFVQFYVISLMSEYLAPKTESAFLDHVIEHESGIYYTFDSKLKLLPPVFESKQASHYLAAIELLSAFPRQNLSCDLYLIGWIKTKMQMEDGIWAVLFQIRCIFPYPITGESGKCGRRTVQSVFQT